MEICPICFEDFEQKIRASPDTCDHVFCLPCLEKWSKLGSYCPVDRKRYRKILNLESEDVIQVKTRKRKRKRAIYDFTTNCEICSKDSDANVLLLCDCCDLGFHLHCLTPPLKEVPSGLWFCPPCVSIEEKLKKQNGITKKVEAELGGISSKDLFDTQVKKDFHSKKEFERKINTPQKLNSHSNLNKSILSACQVVLSDFNNIDIQRNLDQKYCNSDISDNSSGNLEKMCKSFDYESKSCSSKNSKPLKTYSLPNTYRTRSKVIRPPNHEHVERRLRKKTNTNASDMCLSNSEQGDVDLLDRYLTESVYYGAMKFDIFSNSVDNVSDMKIQNNNTDKECMFDEDSSTETYSSEDFSEYCKLYESPCPSPIEVKHKKLNSPHKSSAELNSNSSFSKSKESLDISKKSVHKSSSKSAILATGKHKITPEASSSELSCNIELSKTPKGTLVNLISESLNDNLKGHSEEKMQFSVFEGIGSPQKMCSQFISAGISFTTNISVLRCFICKDKIFAKSQKHCKICKLKGIKKQVLSEKFSKCIKSAKKTIESKCFEENKKKISVVFDNQKHIGMNTPSVLERRQHSLAHKLQELCNSKKKSVISTS